MGWSERLQIEIPATDDSVPGTQIIHYIIWQHIGLDPDLTPREPHLSTTELDTLNHLTPRLLDPPSPTLQRTTTAISRVNIVHDPSPANVPNTLDEQIQAAGQDIGVVRIHCMASPVSPV